MDALGQLCERWDGDGAPSQIEGEAMVPMRLHQIAHVVEIAEHSDGRKAAAAVVRRRAGRQFDPHLATLFLEHQGPLFDAIDDPRVFERFLGLEREPIEWADEKRIDNVARALAILPTSSARSPARWSQR